MVDRVRILNLSSYFRGVHNLGGERGGADIQTLQ